MSAQHFVHTITSKQEQHKRRSLLIRGCIVFAGVVIITPGVLLLVIFPEAGIPLVLAGLGLLALEYYWAGRILLWFARGVDNTVRWYHSLPRKVRYAIELFFLLIAIIVTGLIFR